MKGIFFLPLAALLSATALTADTNAPAPLPDHVRTWDSLVQSARQVLLSGKVDEAETSFKRLELLNPDDDLVRYYLQFILRMRTNSVPRPFVPIYAQGHTNRTQQPVFPFHAPQNYDQEGRHCRAAISLSKSTCRLQEPMQFEALIYSQSAVELYVIDAWFWQSPSVLALYDSRTNYLGDLFRRPADGSQFGLHPTWTAVPARSCLVIRQDLRAGLLVDVHLPGTQYTDPWRPYLPPGDYYVQLLLKPALFAPRTPPGQPPPDCSGTNIVFRSNLLKLTLTN